MGNNLGAWVPSLFGRARADAGRAESSVVLARGKQQDEPPPVLNVPEIVHPDASEAEHRALIAHLREQHLGGVDTDDEAALALEIEQGRLLLVGAGGALVVAITESLGTEDVCTVPLFSGALFLLISLCLAWWALIQAPEVRKQRVHRRYGRYFAELQGYMRAEKNGTAVEYEVFQAEMDAASARENACRSEHARRRKAAAVLLGFGILLTILAGVGTMEPQVCVDRVFAERVPDAEPKPVVSTSATRGVA